MDVKGWKQEETGREGSGRVGVGQGGSFEKGHRERVARRSGQELSGLWCLPEYR